jgi:hypothetical protein
MTCRNKVKKLDLKAKIIYIIFIEKSNKMT